MDKHFKSFFASAMIFSVLAAGCSDNSTANSTPNDTSTIQTTKTTSSAPAATSTSDNNNDENSEENSDDSSETQNIVQLSVNSTDYKSDLTEIFSNNDLNPSYTAENEIILKDNSAEIKGSADINNSSIMITDGGAYRITGNLDDGQIIVNSSEKVWLILDNANIHCSDSSPIYIENSNKTFITLAPDSENTLSDGTSYSYASETQNEPDAVIFSKDNLTINGTGILNINANFNEGITSKDDITITGGKINIVSKGNGIKGKDCVAITSAEINIDSQADGIKSSNAADEGKGFIFIYDGTFNINAVEDAFQSEQEFIINGGNINIVSGEGSYSDYVKQHTDSMMMGGGRGFGGFDMFGQQETDTSSQDTEESVGRKGIKSGGNIFITGGDITADCSDDAIHSNSGLEISGGSYELSSGSHAIHADTTLSITDGKINILKSYEGIEGAVINVSGGEISIISDDDGFNASDGLTQGGMGQNTNGVSLNISGGTIYVNAEGDGLDSNGSMNITGGNTIVDGPMMSGNGALDSNGGIAVEGGTLIAVGSTGMPEYPDNDSKQQFLAMTSSFSKDGTIKICSADGTEIISYKPKKEYSGDISIIISTPDLSADEDYILYIDDSEIGSFKTNDAPAGGSMFGGKGGGGGFDRENMTPPEDFDPGNMTPPDDFDPENMTPPDGFGHGKMIFGENPETSGTPTA